MRRARASVPDDQRALAGTVSTLVAFDYVTGNWDRWSGGNVAQDGATGNVLYVDNDGAFYESPPADALAHQLALLQRVRRFSKSFVDALRALVFSQARLPGRKVVLYLSDGLAFPVGRREIVDNLISLSNRSGVTFYAVDTRGLSVEDATVPALAAQDMTAVESRQKGAVTTQNPVHGYQEMDDVELGAVSNRQQNMQDLAESTGGFAVLNTNQIAEPMQRVM